MNRSFFLKVVLPAAAAVMLTVAVVFVVKSRGNSELSPPPVAPPVTPFKNPIAAAGIVEGKSENISVGAPVGGIVVEVLVQEGNVVKPGTLLFRMDSRHLKAELAMRQAALNSAQAELERLNNLPRKEEIPVSQAQVNQAQTILDEREDTLARLLRLRKTRSIAEETYVQAKFNRAAAKSLLDRASAELKLLKAGSSQWEIGVADAAVKLAEAQREQTMIELQRLDVRSLVEGQVLQVNVRPGEFVGAPQGDPLIMLGDTQQLHVRVDIDENDIPRLPELDAKTPAVASPKGLPSRQIKLTFVRIEPFVIPKRSLTGRNTERVDTRVLQVIFAMDRGARGFYVGQQLDVSIETAKKP